MKLIRLFIVVTFLAACQKDNHEKDLEIVAYMYNKIPKFLSPPPDPHDSIDLATENLTDKNSLKYAVNSNFGIDINSKIPNSFFISNSTKIFEREPLDNDTYQLVQKLIGQRAIPIDKTKLCETLGEEIVFVDDFMLADKYKKNYELDGILSFSKPVFSKEKTTAAIAVGKNGGKLNSSLVIYILKLQDKSWSVTNYLTIEKS